MGKLKFGVFLPFYAFQGKTPHEYYDYLKTLVLSCERFGYNAIWIDDHLMYKNWTIFETWTTLSALSALTSTIRLGTMVSCMPHRNPALLAKAAASFDVLSNGRLEFGIGAGSQAAEHVAYGFDFPPLNQRVERLDEELEVITRLWMDEKATFCGKNTVLRKAVCEPKPLQKPYPPITIGGSGEKLLKVTAKFADRFDWGFVPSLDLYKRKLMVLENNCKAIGRDFNEIEKSCWPSGQVLIADTQRQLNEKIAKAKPKDLSLEDYKKSVLAGTAEEYIQCLKVYVELGVTYFMLFFADLPNIGGLKVFAKDVIRNMP